MGPESIDLSACRARVLGSDVDRLLKVVNKVTTEWTSKKPVTYPYTPHDHSHCEAVEKLLFCLIPCDLMKEKLSPQEIFLLLAAAWLHDIGMHPNLLPDDRVAAAMFDQEETAKNNRAVRAVHPDRSARYVNATPDLGLSSAESNVVARLCRLHSYRRYDGCGSISR